MYPSEISVGGELALTPRVVFHELNDVKERQHTVTAGLEHLSTLADEKDWVLVHDCVRPCVAKADLEKLMAVTQESDNGGLLASPVRDTIKKQDHDRVMTVDRSVLWQAYTPQIFPYGNLKKALTEACEQGITVTDEAQAMERQGYNPNLVTGSASNIKITYPEDLALAKTWFSNHSIAAN